MLRYAVFTIIGLVVAALAAVAAHMLYPAQFPLWLVFVGPPFITFFVALAVFVVGFIVDMIRHPLSFGVGGLVAAGVLLLAPPAHAANGLPSASFLMPSAFFAGIALAWLFVECLGSPTLRRYAIGGALGALTAAVLCAPIPAMAADGSMDTSVTIPWGTWLSSGAGALIEVAVAGLVAAVGWLASKVSTPLASLIKTLLTEQLLTRAVTYGINAVAGAAHDKTLSVKVSNDVVRAAAQYAIDHGPSWLIEWLGTPDHIAEMVIARLKLDESASVSITGTDVVADGAPPVPVSTS